MNKENNRKFNLLMEAAELMPPEPRRQILEKLAEAEQKEDEELEKVIEAVRITLGDLGIIT